MTLRGWGRTVHERSSGRSRPPGSSSLSRFAIAAAALVVGAYGCKDGGGKVDPPDPLVWGQHTLVYDDAADAFRGRFSTNKSDALVACVDSEGVGFSPLQGTGSLTSTAPYEKQVGQSLEACLSCTATQDGETISANECATAGPLADDPPTVSVEQMYGRLDGDEFGFRVTATDASNGDSGLTDLWLDINGERFERSVNGISAEREFTTTLPAGGYDAVACARDLTGQTGCTDPLSVSVMPTAQIEFDIVNGNSGERAEDRSRVSDLEVVVFNQLDEVVMDGTYDSPFTVTAGVGDTLRVSLLKQGYLPHTVAFGQGGRRPWNHPTRGLGLFPVGAGDVRGMMVEDEDIEPVPHIDGGFVYEAVDGLLRWFGNYQRAGYANISWTAPFRVWVNLTDIDAVTRASIDHGITLVRQCAEAPEFTGMTGIREVRYENRDPTEAEWGDDTYWIRFLEDLPSSASAIVRHRGYAQITRTNTDIHSGLFDFKIPGPWGRDFLADMVSVVGLKNSRGDENPLVDDDGRTSPLSRHGEIVCSVINSFDLGYSFPSAAELANPTVGIDNASMRRAYARAGIEVADLPSGLDGF